MTTTSIALVKSQVTSATGKWGVEPQNKNRPLRHSMVQVTPIFRMHDEQSMQSLITDSIVRTEGVSASQENITGFGLRVAGGILRSNTEIPSVHIANDKMEDKPPSWLNYWVKLHVPGMTHVSHEAACVPSTCVPFFHTFPLLGT
jgi:hypothetical protein